MPPFLDAIGLRIERLIDSIPILGVPTPIQPWSPLTDTKAAVLSDPFYVLKSFLNWDVAFKKLLQGNLLYLDNVENDGLNAEEVMSDEEGPICVTSDDASVERSVASFTDLNIDEDGEEESYEECLAITTECGVEKIEKAENKDIEVNSTRETEDKTDEDEYVLAENVESDEEDFVDISAED